MLSCRPPESRRTQLGQICRHSCSWPLGLPGSRALPCSPRGAGRCWGGRCHRRSHAAGPQGCSWACPSLLLEALQAGCWILHTGPGMEANDMCACCNELQPIHSSEGGGVSSMSSGSCLLHVTEPERQDTWGQAHWQNGLSACLGQRVLLVRCGVQGARLANSRAMNCSCHECWRNARPPEQDHVPRARLTHLQSGLSACLCSLVLLAHPEAERKMPCWPIIGP